MRTLIGSFFLMVGAVCGLCSPLAFAADSWLMPGHDASSTNFNSGEHVIGRQNVSRLHRIWTYSRVVQAVASDKRVYAIVASSPRWMVAVLDARTGKLLRAIPASSLHYGSRQTDYPDIVAYARGKLIVGTTSAVLGVDPDTGRVYWRTPGGASVLTVKGGAVYTGKGCQNTPDVCGTLASYALDAQTGKLLWLHQGNGGGLPVAVAGRLFQPWGMFMPQTRVYDPAGGQLVATLPLTAEWTGDARSAYADVLTGPGKPWWLGEIAPSGKPTWKLSLGRVSGNSRPVLAYNALFVASNRFHPGIIAVDARNGHIQWGADVGALSSVVAANHLIYAMEEATGRVDVLDAGTGATVTRLAVPGANGGGSGQLFVSGGTLYVLDDAVLDALRL